jgi:DNA/RNA endonuclease G (NUC1)
MAGGDRDRDGLRATNDPYDACTVYEVNYMSNIAPKFQTTFNGPGGLWYELEGRIRLNIVGGDYGGPIHIIAGTVFGNEEIARVGAGNIPVPHMFFQILITPYGVVPFLFVHTAQIGSQGCALTAALPDCIVAVADIEAVTGLDFFTGFDSAFGGILQTPDGAAVWRVLDGE